MNKLLVTLIAASLSALLLAAGCGAWLFWQSWEEGKRLERQNRELRASLEASRIRLDNFCEYPMEALCDVDGPHGTVSDAMASLPEPAAPQMLPAAEQPAPAASSAKDTTPPPADAGLQEKSAASGTAPAEEPAPQEKALSPAKTVQKNGAHSSPVQSPASDIAVPSSPDSTAPKKAPDSSEEEKKVSEPRAAEIVPPSDKNAGKSSEANNEDAAPKKTWTTVERRAGSLLFRIAGAGPSLTGQGIVHEQPLRCEVTLPGLWNIAPRKVNTSLVQGMETSFRNGDTVLTFPLAQRPTLCEVKQEDARTIAIRLQ